MTTDPLTVDQRQRIAVLYATWDALHVGEIDCWDLIRSAHWVYSGQELPTQGGVIKGYTESLGLDEASWHPEAER